MEPEDPEKVTPSRPQTRPHERISSTAPEPRPPSAYEAEDFRKPMWRWLGPGALVALLLSLCIVGPILLFLFGAGRTTPTSSMAWIATSTAAKTTAATKPKKRDANSMPLQLFVGRWILLDDQGKDAGHIDIKEDKTANKSDEPDIKGTWEIVDNVCRITWPDRSTDMLRPQPDGVVRLYFKPRADWLDPADKTQRTRQDPLPK